jgi:hypothetical protein
MDKNQTITLIKGEFSPNETAEILFSLINEKIRFHDLQIFGSMVRKDGNPEPHAKRLEELNHAKKIIQNIIEQAKINNEVIVINSTIKLELKVIEKAL